MFISGLSCSYCGGKLEVLRMVEGVLHTKCTCCETVSEPTPKIVNSNLPTSTSELSKPFKRKVFKNSGVHARVEISYRPKKSTQLWTADKEDL